MHEPVQGRVSGRTSSGTPVSPTLERLLQPRLASAPARRCSGASAWRTAKPTPTATASATPRGQQHGEEQITREPIAFHQRLGKKHGGGGLFPVLKYA